VVTVDFQKASSVIYLAKPTFMPYLDRYWYRPRFNFRFRSH